MASFQEFEVMSDQGAGAGDVGHEDYRKNPPNSGVTNSPGEEQAPKARKPYTISKQRERWTEDEHKLFLESLQLHGRAWRRIQEHIGSKTAVQIRSHAQKFFAKVTRESSSDGSNCDEAAAPRIRIPPPRPKRKPAHPYPRKLGNAPGKDAPPALNQLHKHNNSLDEMESGSPKSVLTVPAVAPETLASDGARSPASSVDVEERCPAPRIAAAGEVATQLPPCKTANGDTASKHVTSGVPQSPVLRLFGNRVVLNELHRQPISNTENEQDTAADMELDESVETPTSGTGSSNGSADANTPSSWPTDTHQFMYYLPRGKVLFVPSDCQFFMLNPQAKKQHQLSQGFTNGEGSCSESITTTSSDVPETLTQNSDYVESTKVTNNEEDEVVPVPGSRKYVHPTPDCLRGFMPYKRCTAESETVQSQMSGVEADREMTRLCL